MAMPIPMKRPREAQKLRKAQKLQKKAKEENNYPQDINPSHIVWNRQSVSALLAIITLAIVLGLLGYVFLFR